MTKFLRLTLVLVLTYLALASAWGISHHVDSLEEESRESSYDHHDDDHDVLDEDSGEMLLEMDADADAAPQNGPGYVGCFRIRYLRGKRKNHHLHTGKFDVASCRAMATAGGDESFVLSDRGGCISLDKFEFIGYTSMVSDAYCNEPCLSNPAEFCGGQRPKDSALTFNPFKRDVDFGSLYFTDADAGDKYKASMNQNLSLKPVCVTSGTVNSDFKAGYGFFTAQMLSSINVPASVASDGPCGSYCDSQLGDGPIEMKDDIYQKYLQSSDLSIRDLRPANADGTCSVMSVCAVHSKNQKRTKREDMIVSPFFYGEWKKAVDAAWGKEQSDAQAAGKTINPLDAEVLNFGIPDMRIEQYYREDVMYHKGKCDPDDQSVQVVCNIPRAYIEGRYDQRVYRADFDTDAAYNQHLDDLKAYGNFLGSCASMKDDEMVPVCHDGVDSTKPLATVLKIYPRESGLCSRPILKAYSEKVSGPQYDSAPNCPAGQFGIKFGVGAHWACRSCKAGTFQPHSGQLYNQKAGKDPCVPCAAGFGSDQGAHTCQKCNRGTYSTFGSGCRKCPVKTFAPDIGTAGKCLPCPGNENTEGQYVCDNPTTDEITEAEKIEAEEIKKAQTLAADIKQREAEVLAFQKKMEEAAALAAAARADAEKAQADAATAATNSQQAQANSAAATTTYNTYKTYYNNNPVTDATTAELNQDKAAADAAAAAAAKAAADAAAAAAEAARIKAEKLEVLKTDYYVFYNTVKSYEYELNVVQAAAAKSDSIKQEMETEENKAVMCSASGDPVIRQFSGSISREYFTSSTAVLYQSKVHNLHSRYDEPGEIKVTAEVGTIAGQDPVIKTIHRVVIQVPNKDLGVAELNADTCTVKYSGNVWSGKDGELNWDPMGGSNGAKWKVVHGRHYASHELRVHVDANCPGKGQGGTQYPSLSVRLYPRKVDAAIATGICRNPQANAFYKDVAHYPDLRKAYFEEDVARKRVAMTIARGPKTFHLIYLRRDWEKLLGRTLTEAERNPPWNPPADYKNQYAPTIHQAEASIWRPEKAENAMYQQALFMAGHQVR